MLNDVVIILAVLSFGSLIVWTLTNYMRLNLLSNKVYGLAKSVDKIIEVQGTLIKMDKNIIEHIKYLEGKKK